MKKYVIILLLIIVMLLGLFIPLDSYTTTKGCSVDPTPTQRLHLIFGDSINDVKNGDVEPPPNAGCAKNTKFVLYLF